MTDKVTTDDSSIDGAASALSAGLCSMVIIETPTFACLWECSWCHVQHKATKKFYGNKTCPSCGKKISKWFGEDDEIDA